MIKRDNSLDYFKGISIVAIMLLHFEVGVFPEYLNVWVGSFMITTFYFASGWLLSSNVNKIDITKHVNKRMKNVVIPYVWFSVVIIIFDVILLVLNLKDLDFLLSELYKTFTLRGIGTLWFLPALFFGEIIVIYLLESGVHVKLLMLIVTIIYLLFYWWWTDNYAYTSTLFKIMDVPLRTIANISRAWITIYGAYLIHKNFVNYFLKIVNVMNGKVTLVMLFFSFIISVSFPLYIPGYIYMPFIGPLFVFILCPLCVFAFSKAYNEKILSSFFIYWGRNSLILMAIHYSFLLQLSHLFDSFISGENNYIGFKTLIYFSLSLLFSYPITFFINKKLSFMLGK
jgi:fucose 4-O-acetylase-like acetyltransferase